MKKIKINNVKKTVYNCLECNKPLTDYEYNSCRIFCTSCFSKYYDRLSGSYNDVDEILMKKAERR